MIAEADVLARRDHIYKLLGSKAQDASYMRNRPARHHRIIRHLGIMWSYSKGAWRVAPEQSGAIAENGPRSMRTEENRREYARKALQKEWAATGMSEDGMSQETAIEFD